MYERVERIEALAREIAPLVGADPDTAAQAARLAKADLSTGMVGEFPELQGVMGRYYALAQEPFPLDGGRAGLGVDTPALGSGAQVGGGAQPRSSSSLSGHTPTQPSPIEGEGSAVADAIRDHYKPQGPSDAVPTAPVSVAVALADKLDTLVGFFAIDEKPTGSRDPFALRRAALGVIRIVLASNARLSISAVSSTHYDLIPSNGRPRLRHRPADGVFQDTRELLDFFGDRLKVLLRDQGKRHDLVDAVFALGDDDLVRIVARVEALGDLLTTEDGANLLAGYKRATNILKAEEKKGALPAGPAERMSDAPPEETALVNALASVAPRVEADLASEDFTAAMRALAALRAPVDGFFEHVLVNDPDPETRDNRLRLLIQVRELMGRVADFSLVTG